MYRSDRHAINWCWQFSQLENSSRRQEIVKDVAVHISQAIVSSLKSIGKLAVVYAELV